MEVIAAMKLILTLAALMALTLSASAEDSTFDSKGVKIRYVTEGEGEAVVLVHGWMSDSTMWGKDATGKTKLVAPDGFQVVALDCRGHGLSDKPHEVKKYGAEMADDVIRLMDHLRIKRAHLIGYSMGAFIVAKVAARNPGRVLSIIYGGQAPLFTGNAGAHEIDVFAKLVDEGKGLGPYLMEFAPTGTQKLTLSQANSFAKLIYGSKDVRAFSAAGRSFKGLEVTERDLKKCQAPVLFIYGDMDVSRARIEEVNKLVGGDVKIVPNANHITALGKPEFGSTIVSFLLAHKSKP